MRVFNRIVLIVLLAGLVALGIAAVFYAFDVAGYMLADVPNTLGLSGIYQGVEGFVGNVEEGNLDPLGIVVLVAIALVGLVLLFLELKPPTPRLVRMQQGTYITRGAVESEAVTAAEENAEVLQSNVGVGAKRRPGAKVNVTASVRRGEDVSSLQSRVRERVQRHLAETGIPVSNLKVRVVESDPRGTKSRVK